MEKTELDNLIKNDTDFYSDFSKYLKFLNKETENEYKNIKEKENIKIKKINHIIILIILLLLGLYFYYNMQVYLVIGLILIIGIIISASKIVSYSEGFYDGYRRAKGFCKEDNDIDALKKMKNNFIPK
ncbi:MAG: hypothetical protein PHH98_01140 [Candidatus Gracilibacteria bacterium]|nr:hypothetical protein [Candidatus Gracilibacteria bacterium]